VVSLTRRGPVLHLVPAAFGSGGVLGGAERYAFELARAMARRVPTRLLTFGDRRERRIEDALEIVVEPGRPVRGQVMNRWSPALVHWVLAARVVHCHQRAVLASSTTALLGRLTRRRTFVTDLGGGGWDLSAYVDTSRWFSGHLHISDYSVRVNGHEGRSDARIIGGGIDTVKFSPDPRVPRDGSVLFVGRVMPHKGIDDLVAAIEGEKLRIVGMPYDARFATDLRELARGKDVEFIEGLGDAELVHAYRRASVVVLASVYKTRYGTTTLVPELLGQTALEGQACGTPAICTDVASLPEVVVQGETGFLVPPNDPMALRARIRWLLEHPAESLQMGEKGRKRVVDQFNWDAVVERCLDAYATCS
jgi:glycosyltransferase involved in cell wall biosynthesis